MKRISQSKNQTQKLAKQMAQKVIQQKTQKAVLIGLSGELGGGKTTFVQGFAKALGIKKKVTSPTFVLMKCLQLSIPSFAFLIHLDAYRIKKSKEILDLGWRKLIKNPQNIILVEWAEKIKKIFPKKYFWIKFSHLGPHKRLIDISLKK
ncbi:MAG: tRNA (adenosine(37)-N6)-threonylcarbamoyltransferase complex ATPase subunit type 1 TsaE [Patescibacteria group bacterium]